MVAKECPGLDNYHNRAVAKTTWQPHNTLHAQTIPTTRKNEKQRQR